MWQEVAALEHVFVNLCICFFGSLSLSLSFQWYKVGRVISCVASYNCFYGKLCVEGLATTESLFPGIYFV